MYLEFEDLFIVLGAAAVMNIIGRSVGGEIAGMRQTWFCSMECRFSWCRS